VARVRSVKRRKSVPGDMFIDKERLLFDCQVGGEGS
jgi:hypothetical protein